MSELWNPGADGTVNAPDRGIRLASAAPRRVPHGAFVLGPDKSIPLLVRMGVEGLIVTADLELHRTPGLCHA